MDSTLMPCSLEIVLQHQGLSPVVVWEYLYSSHRQFLTTRVNAFDGSACRAQEVGKRIAGDARLHFEVSWPEGVITYGHVANHDLSLVNVDHAVESASDAESWVAPFLESEAFRQAWLYDDEYHLWQNASDILEYESRGKSMHGLPTRSNGLPPPLSRLEIDTSRNPGRRVLRQGFIEAVGSPMWLGKSFWDLVRPDPSALSAVAGLAYQPRGKEAVRLDVADSPFTSSEGEDAAVQNRLRDALYPREGKR